MPPWPATLLTPGHRLVPLPPPPPPPFPLTTAVTPAKHSTRLSSRWLAEWALYPAHCPGCRVIGQRTYLQSLTDLARADWTLSKCSWPRLLFVKREGLTGVSETVSAVWVALCKALGDWLSTGPLVVHWAGQREAPPSPNPPTGRLL